MVSQKPNYVRPRCHIQQDFEPVRSPVQYIPQHIEGIVLRKLNGLQHGPVFFIIAVNIRHHIGHYVFLLKAFKAHIPRYIDI